MTEKAKAAGKPYRVLSKEVELERYQEFITMNWRLLVNLNPKIIKHLGSTSPTVFNNIEFGDLDDEGAEAAMSATDNENPDRVEVKYNKSHTTAKVSFFRLVSKYPALRVPRGRIRKFPVTLRTENGVSYLALNLKASTVEPSPVRKKKNDGTTDTAPESKTAQGAKASKDGAAAGEQKE